MKTNKNISDDAYAPAYNSEVPEGIYIHIPFCISKCIYCDFTSYAGCSDDVQRRYFDALRREAALLRRLKFSGARPLPDTVFIGGGTPSSADASYIAAVLDELPRTPGAEITIECNPAAVLRDRLEVYLSAGINRLSMGVQSFDDEELAFLGRAHSGDEAEESFINARRAGFDNINLDLIFGFPGQTEESWKKTLKRAVGLSPEHISFYSLQIEEGTVMYEKFRHGDVEQIPDEVNRVMYHQAVRYLKDAGYEIYEISNAAKPGFRCRHNMKYWTMAPYTGIGAAAHSFDGRFRFYNPGGIDDYISAVSEKCRTESLTGSTYAEENTMHDSMTDYIFTGLRLTDGIDTHLFKKMFAEDLLGLKNKKIMQFVDEGFLELSENRLRFTEPGIDISNYIIGELISD